MFRKRFKYFVSWSTHCGFGSGFLFRDCKFRETLKEMREVQACIAKEFAVKGVILMYYKYVGVARKGEE